MRIHRITLRNYRGVTEAEVCLPATGVTIIEGSNEIGKTSLVEAVQRLLKFRDDSTDSAIRSVHPVGADSSPEVIVEMSTGPYRFTYGKRWHRKRGATTLAICEPNRQHLRGRDAHQWVQQALAETMDVSLWDALRLEQGTGPTATSFAGARSLSQALDLAVGGDAESQQDDALWDRIVAERDRYWSATGKPRVEGVDLHRRLAEAETERNRIEGDLANLQRQAEEAARLETEGVQLTRQAVDSSRKVNELSERAAKVGELRAEAQRVAATHDAAAAEESRLSALRNRRVELETQAVRSSAAVEQAERKLAEAEPRRAAAEHRHGAAAAALEGARSELQAAEAAHRLAVDDSDYRRQQIELAQLTERRDRVLEARSTLAQATRELGSLRVTDRQVAAIEAAHLEQARAAAAANASAASVTAVAHAALEVEVDGRTVALDSGQREELAVTGSVKLVVPGFVTLQVRAGIESTERAARLAAADVTLGERCREAGVADLVEARAAAAARHEAANARTRAAEVITRDLRDLTLAALAQKVERLAPRVAAYETIRSPEPPVPPDDTRAQAQARSTEAALVAAREAVVVSEKASRAAELASHQAQVDGSALVKELELAQAAEARDQRVLVDARAEQSDQAICEAALSASRAREDAHASLAAFQRALRHANADAVEHDLDEAHRAQGRAEAARSAKEAQLHALQGALEARGEQGLSHDLDEAITREQRLRREVTAWDDRANAARRLHQAFEARRSQSRQRYEAPLRERIEELGRIVFGPTLEVELGPDFRLMSRTLRGTTVSYDQLSTGAKEQFSVLTRLACATIVSPDGGVPVVFDDALGWTDPQRLAGVAAAITEAGRSCQVIILTCTPGRFATVADAITIHLGPAWDEAAAGPIHGPRATTPSRRAATRSRADDGAPTLFPSIDDGGGRFSTERQRSAR